MDNETVSHMTICNFINDYIVDNQIEIFSFVVGEIFKECQLPMDTLFIDGSKFEANANKYKFV